MPKQVNRKLKELRKENNAVQKKKSDKHGDNHHLDLNIADIVERNDNQAFFSLFVKILSSQIAGHSQMVVGDKSGMIPLIYIGFNEHEQHSLKVGAVYQLLRAQFVENPEGGGSLIMAPGSYAAEMKNMRIPEVEVLPRQHFTSKNLQDVNDKDKVFIKGPMMMILDRVYKTKVSQTSDTIYRQAQFKDEYNTVKMGAFADACKRFDKWEVGKIYNIQDFNTNRYIDKSGVKINMTWIDRKTKVTEVNEADEEDINTLLRISALKALKTEFIGTIMNYTPPHYYDACLNCGKSVNFDRDLVHTYDYITQKTVSGPPACDCGIPITKDMKTEKKYDLKIIFDNKKNETCHVVHTFSSQLEHINLFMTYPDDETFLRTLIGAEAKVEFDETIDKKTGQSRLTMKHISLISTYPDVEEGGAEYYSEMVVPAA